MLVHFISLNLHSVLEVIFDRSLDGDIAKKQIIFTGFYGLLLAQDGRILINVSEMWSGLQKMQTCSMQ